MLKTPQAMTTRKIRLLLKKEFPEVQFTYTSKAALKSYREPFPRVSVVWTNCGLSFGDVVKVMRDHFSVLREFEECSRTIKIILHYQENHYDGRFRTEYLYVKGESLS